MLLFRYLKDLWKACWGRYPRGKLLQMAMELVNAKDRFKASGMVIIRMGKDGYGTLEHDDSQSSFCLITVIEAPSGRASCKCPACGRAILPRAATREENENISEVVRRRTRQTMSA